MGSDSGDIKTNSSQSSSGYGSIPRHIYDRLPKVPATIKLKLPRTPSDLKQWSTVYRVQQENTDYAIDYKYKQWCIFVPDPGLTKDIKGHTDKVTKLVDEMREGIGMSMGSNALFMAFVKDNGELDLGLAGSIKNALNLRNSHFPILIICNKPILRISSEGVKKRWITKDEKPDLILVRFGRSTENELSKTLKMLGDELAKPDNQLSGRGIGRSRLFIRLRLAATNIGKVAVAAGKEVIVPMIVAYFVGK